MSFDLLDRARRNIGVRLGLWYAFIFTLSTVALFALAYIRITQGLRDDLARPHPRFFRYRGWLTYLDG